MRVGCESICRGQYSMGHGMWTAETRGCYDRSKLRYPSDETDAAEWALIEPLIPPAKHGGRKRSVNMREVVNALFYVLETGYTAIHSRSAPFVARRGARAAGRRRACRHCVVPRARRGPQTLRRPLGSICAGLAGSAPRAVAGASGLSQRRHRSPSVPPSSGSTACSGCGIGPSTLPLWLSTPAISSTLPFGFASA